jgi:tetratricopeptide (TPR) repeat protein
VIVLSVGPVPAPQAAERVRVLLEEVRGSPLHEAILASFLASFEAVRGRRAEAEQSVAWARRAMGEHGERLWRLSIELAYVPLRSGDPAGAERELRPAYEALESMGEKTHLSTVLELLANTVYLLDRYGEAEALTRECEEVARANDVHAQIRWRAVRAKAIAQRGDVETAEQLAHEAVALAADSDFLNDRADTLVDHAEVLRLAGRPTEAAAAVESAIALYERKENIPAAAAARALLDELRGAHSASP